MFIILEAATLQNIRHFTISLDQSKFYKQANEEALVYGTRLLSCYRTTGDDRLYIITEWVRSMTTVMLPSEY